MKAVLVLALFVACASASSIIQFKPSLPTGRVIKGVDAVEHAAPYIVSLSTKATSHSHICGGTIIAKDWIVTAAHCISSPVGMGVIAGLHVRAEVNEKTQSRVVDFGLKHADFAGGVGPYDIALLHVSEPFVYNEWVQPAILPQREEIHSGEAKLYGWGQVKAFNFAAAKVLQTVTTQLIEYNECEETLGEGTPLRASNVCTDSLQQGISACNGDSGGPLVQEHEGVASELVGIVSWGYIPCGYGNKPSIYTRVSAYIDWIAQVQSAYYTLN
ncbi:lectizyme [Bactrocera neohumeralis]|uniref:lectizyme n=1 Tax=Bactrocera neohumeralis TaxID=98809 RepID=UPI0021664B06|nr:lectizyme [Bactrocera neohumeralis]